MRTRTASSQPGVFLVLLASLAMLAACGSATTSVVPTVTAAHPTLVPTHAAFAPTATAAAPPPHAFAWTQYDGTSVPQIWASLNGAAPIQITHFAPPAGPGCDSWFLWSPPVFSPDLTHIVAAIGGSQCGDGPLFGPVSVITVANGAIANVPGSNQGIRLSQRTTGWLDNQTIFFVNGSGLYTYSLGAAAPTQLPGIASAEEAVLRGTTLFYAVLNYGSTINSEVVHRYDMTAHTVLSGSISLGQYNSCPCSPGDYPTLGWDVSRDGSHVAYQLATAGASTGGFGMGSSQVWYASADGSGATRIAQALTGTAFLRIQLAPDGALVAITSTDPAGPVVSAGVSSPGLPGDPAFHTFAPSALQFPVWKWDSTQFWAATKSTRFDTPAGNLYNYQVSAGSSVVGVSGGYNPWYTLGS